MSRTKLAPDKSRNNQRALPAAFGDVTAVYSYWDVARLWLRSPLDDEQVRALRQYAGGKKMRVWNKVANFNPEFVQRLTLYQPRPQAFELLAHRNDALINYTEAANDLIFSTEDSKIDGHRFVDRTHVKRHRGKQHLGYAGEGKAVTRYTGPRAAPLNLVAYSDQHCRITGEVDCLHQEWRINSAAACRAAGIHSVRDLLTFNHRAFWERHYLLAEIDKRKFGRMVRYQQSGKRRPSRIITVGKFTYDVDLRVGATITKALGSTQKVIDHYKRVLPVGRCLIPIEVASILP